MNVSRFPCLYRFFSSSSTSSLYGSKHIPSELRLRVKERRLEVSFPNKNVDSNDTEQLQKFSLPAELLRVYSPSAGA
jgi:hypothetical protein